MCTLVLQVLHGQHALESGGVERPAAVGDSAAEHKSRAVQARDGAPPKQRVGERGKVSAVVGGGPAAVEGDGGMEYGRGALPPRLGAFGVRKRSDGRAEGVGSGAGVDAIGRPAPAAAQKGAGVVGIGGIVGVGVKAAEPDDDEFFDSDGDVSGEDATAVVLDKAGDEDAVANRAVSLVHAHMAARMVEAERMRDLALAQEAAASRVKVCYCLATVEGLARLSSRLFGLVFQAKLAEDHRQKQRPVAEAAVPVRDDSAKPDAGRAPAARRPGRRRSVSQEHRSRRHAGDAPLSPPAVTSPTAEPGQAALRFVGSPVGSADAARRARGAEPRDGAAMGAAPGREQQKPIPTSTSVLASVAAAVEGLGEILKGRNMLGPASAGAGAAPALGVGRASNVAANVTPAAAAPSTPRSSRSGELGDGVARAARDAARERHHGAVASVGDSAGAAPSGVDRVPGGGGGGGGAGGGGGGSGGGVPVGGHSRRAKSPARGRAVGGSDPHADEWQQVFAEGLGNEIVSYMHRAEGFVDDGRAAGRKNAETRQSHGNHRDARDGAGGSASESVNKSVSGAEDRRSRDASNSADKGDAVGRRFPSGAAAAAREKLAGQTAALKRMAVAEKVRCVCDVLLSCPQ